MDDLLEPVKIKRGNDFAVLLPQYLHKRLHEANA